MTSIGVMASGVLGTTATDVLLEPFNNLTAWTIVSGTPTIVAARTGNGLSNAGATPVVSYSIGAPQQSDWVTVGFAFRVSTLGSARPLMAIRGGLAQIVVSLQVETDGSLTVRNSSASVLATSATGLFVTNTFYYLEAQVFAHDTAGSVAVRRNGTQIATATNVDTLGGPGLINELRIGPSGSGATQIYDDLYLTMGAGAVFKGSITIP